jgi:hypothetical protein
MKPIYIFIFLGSLLFLSCKENQTQLTPKSSSFNNNDKEADEYFQFLKNLDPNKIENLSAAVSRYQKLFEHADKQTSDTAFYQFWLFYNSTMDSITNKFSVERDYNSLAHLSQINDVIPDDKKKELKKEYSNLREEDFQLQQQLIEIGMMLDMEEGYLYVNIGSSDFIKNNFQKFLSAEMNKFILQTCKERKEKYAGDGAIIIPVKEVAVRAIWWELFLNEFPNFMLSNEAEVNYDIYLEALLQGLDNTPAFDYETQILGNEFKEAYQFVLKSHGNSKTSKIISEYLKVLQKNKFTLTNEVRSFLKKHTQEQIGD